MKDLRKEDFRDGIRDEEETMGEEIRGEETGDESSMVVGSVSRTVKTGDGSAAGSEASGRTGGVAGSFSIAEPSTDENLRQLRCFVTAGSS